MSNLILLDRTLHINYARTYFMQIQHGFSRKLVTQFLKECKLRFRVWNTISAARNARGLVWKLARIQCSPLVDFFAQKDDVGLYGFEVADLRQPPPFLETKGVEQADAGVVVAEDDGDDVFDA